jgi:hypothetical protein
VFQEQGPFEHTFAVVRSGHEGIYRDFVAEFDTFAEHEDCTEGNAFVLHRPDAYNHYKAHCVRCDQQVEKLVASGHDVVSVRLPKSKYRYHRFKMRHRAFALLRPSDEQLEHWAETIKPKAVIFHLRHISRSKKKNTPLGAYEAAYRWARKHKRQFVTVGRTAGFAPLFEIRGIDLLNKTSLDDLLAIFHLGGMVVGSSSGPMHLAAATGTPHVVWGGGRSDVRNRYLKEWNPFKTPVNHLTNKFAMDGKTLQKALLRMSDNPETDSRRRARMESAV